MMRMLVHHQLKYLALIGFDLEMVVEILEPQHVLELMENCLHGEIMIMEFWDIIIQQNIPHPDNFLVLGHLWTFVEAMQI